MKTTFLVAAMFLLCIAGEVRVSKAVQLEWTAQMSSAAAWNGFGSDFQPNWDIETTVVKTTPAVQAALNTTGSYATMCSSGTWCVSGILKHQSWQEQRWTVNRTSASTVASTNAVVNYLLADKEYSESNGDSRRNSSSNWAELADAAVIVTDKDILLADASALAYQNANLGLRSFTANGRVSADGILKTGITTADSTASAQSCFDATYSLEKKTAFSLSLDLAKYLDTDLDFSIVDARTGSLLWDLTPEQAGTSYHFQASGLLDAGEYKFALTAKANTLIDQHGVQDLGGAAMYDVSLDFAAESYMVTVSSFPVVYRTNDSTEPTKLVGSDCILTGPPITSTGNIVFASLPVNASNNLNLGSPAVPEPGTMALLLSLGGAFLLVRMIKRK